MLPWRHITLAILRSHARCSYHSAGILVHMGIHRLAVAKSSSCQAKCLQRQLCSTAAGNPKISGAILKLIPHQNSDSSNVHGNSASSPACVPSSRAPYFSAVLSNRSVLAQTWLTKDFRGWEREGMHSIFKRALHSCEQSREGGFPPARSSSERSTPTCYSTRRGMLFQKPKQGSAFSHQEQHAVIISIFGTGATALHWYLSRDVASSVQIASVTTICASLLLPQVQGFLRRTRLAKSVARALHHKCHQDLPQNRFLRMVLISAQSMLTSQNHIRDDVLDLRESMGYITRHGMVKSLLGDNVQLTASKLTREVGACVCVCMYCVYVYMSI